VITGQERIVCGDIPYYPGHPITLAVQIALAFPTHARTEHGWPAALSSSKVDGAGGSVYSALQALDKLAKGESLETVLAWADGCREYPYRADWPAACVQARRYLERLDLTAYAAPTQRAAGEE
jgi:hypothetical protein